MGCPRYNQQPATRLETAQPEEATRTALRPPMRSAIEPVRGAVKAYVQKPHVRRKLKSSSFTSKRASTEGARPDDTLYLEEWGDGGG